MNERTYERILWAQERRQADAALSPEERARRAHKNMQQRVRDARLKQRQLADGYRPKEGK